jgi:hypothetical protein
MKPDQAEQLARTRAVKGFSFKELPKEENDAIFKFLNGGPCPEGYRELYKLCRTQLGLPAVEVPKQFELNHAAIHEADPGKCIPCDKVREWKENEGNA